VTTSLTPASASAPKKAHWPSGLISAARIAAINLFRRNITIQYPKQRYDQPDRSRWAVEQVFDEAGMHRCTACKICEQSCSDKCIHIDVETREDKTKFIHAWNYERAACMMCGLCVEACPYGAIRMGHDYELAHSASAEKRIDLLREVEAIDPRKKQAADTQEAPDA